MTSFAISQTTKGASSLSSSPSLFSQERFISGDFSKRVSNEFVFEGNSNTYHDLLDLGISYAIEFFINIYYTKNPIQNDFYISIFQNEKVIIEQLIHESTYPFFQFNYRTKLNNNTGNFIIKLRCNENNTTNVKILDGSYYTFKKI